MFCITIASAPSRHESALLSLECIRKKGDIKDQFILYCIVLVQRKVHKNCGTKPSSAYHDAKAEFHRPLKGDLIFKGKVAHLKGGISKQNSFQSKFEQANIAD